MSSYGYSYVPDTAGGTAFMYHLNVGGHLITNLRLSGKTLMKIFTGQITNWDNPAIKKDYGAQLPNIPIIPVVRSDGSGATFFLTRWMAHLFPSDWNAFCTKVTHGRVHGTCGQTEFYPTSGWGNVKAENGSNNVATYITASYANGAIGYDEYAYALNSHYPVVKVLNPAGYYVLPTRLQRRGRADQGADQRGQEQQGLPPAEPGQRLHASPTRAPTRCPATAT